MPSQIGKLKIALLILLLISCTGIIAYGVLYQIPRNKCERAGGWWSDKFRHCYTPIYLPTITGRKPGEPQKNVTVDFHEDAKKASNAGAVNKAATTSSGSSASK